MNAESHKNLIVYNASAGSGKTYTLALEYLAICLNDPSPRSFRKILAITFTNKAAHELKERILQFMERLGQGMAEAALLDGILERTGLSTQEVTSRARSCHRAMLFHYSDIHISTIDSFVLSVLRAFSKELGKSFDFDVELDQKKILDMMVDSILSQVGKDEHMTTQLAQLVTQNLDEGRSWNPKDAMLKALTHLMDEESIPYRNILADLGESKLVEQLNELDQKRRKKWSIITKHQEDLKTTIRELGIGISDFNGGRRGFISFVFKDLKKEKPPTSGQLEHVAHKNLESPAARKEGKKDLIEGLRPQLIKSQSIIVEQLDSLKILDNLHRNKISSILALRLQNLLQKLEDEEGMSFLQDNNHKISDLIKDNPTPFIYERIGERFQHFLIDEFQDTSILQWRNMLPLIDGSLAYGRVNFLVGDAKQSIYRWRGGEVDQMVDLPSIPGSNGHIYLKQIEQNFDRALRKMELGTNYRSSESVIQFNNELFPILSKQLSERYLPSYKDVRQEIHRKESSGYVRMELLEEKLKLEDCLERVLEIIRKCENDGYHGSDICMLSRSNKDGRILAKHLEAEGYSVSSPDSLLLTGHADVQMLMSFIDILSGSEAHGPVLYVIERLLERADRVTEYHYWASSISMSRRGISVLEELMKELGIAWNIDRFKDLDVYQNLQELVLLFKVSDRDPYIQELFNQAIGFCQGSDSTLSGFMDFWEERKGSLCVKAGVNRESIQIMTIHRSKGLQFPVVILPLISWKSVRLTKKKEWVHLDGMVPEIGLLNINSSLDGTEYSDTLSQEKARTDLDELNLFYVACTRAEDRMYVHVSDPGKGGLSKKLSLHIQEHSENGIIEVGSEERRTEIEEENIPLPEIRAYQRERRKDLLSVALSKEDWNRKQRQFGQSVHQVMETAFSRNDIQRVVSEILPEGIYSKEDRDHVLKASMSAFQIEQDMGWIHSDLIMKREVEVMDRKGNSYRIDKLYLDAHTDRAIIVDYKTGMKAEKDVKQIQGYKELMRNIGWKDVQGYLIYTELEELQEI